MKTGGQHYKRFVPDYDNLLKRGKVKKLSDKNAAKKKEVATNLSKHVFRKAKLDPDKVTKQGT